VSRRAAAALVAGAGGAAFALGFGIGRGRDGAGAARSAETLTVTRITSSGNVTEAAISPDGRLVAYVESYQGGQSLWLRQLATGQTLRLVPERRGAYWGHVFTRDGNSIVYGYKGAGPEELDSFYSISTLGGTPPAFSPDGSRMAWVRARHPTPDESALMLARSDGSEARVLAAFKLPERVAPIFFTAPDWSPDGRRIACSVVRRLAGAVDGGARIVAVGVDDGRVETLAEPQWTSAAQLAWLPDSSGLLAVGTPAIVEASQVWLVPLPSGEPRRVTTDLLEYRIVSLTADGRSLLTVAADAVASVWLGAPGRDEPPRRLTGSRLDGMFGLDFLPDGRLVYTSADTGDEALWVTSADASERTPLAAGEGVAREPRATRSGRIFYLARTRSAGEVRSLSPDGSAPRVVASGAFGGGLAVSPDERQVVFTALGENEIRLFRVSAEGGTPEPVTDYAASFPAFSPDGRHLAFYYVDRASGRFRIGIVAAEGGPILRSLDAAAPNFYSRMLFRAEGLYVNSLETDRANVWLVPLDGKPPRRITSFQDSLVYGFAFSPDGRSLAYSRGPRTRDALLIRGFQ
jgi:Tol biopolymer transport system component